MSFCCRFVVNFYFRIYSIIIKSMGDKEYKCDVCNYATSDRGNYYRHTKSKRHLKKVGEDNNKNIVNIKTAPQNAPDHPRSPQITKKLTNMKKLDSNVCNFCGLECARASSLVRHEKICSERVVYELRKELENKDKQFNLAIKNKEKELNVKIEMLENYNDELKSDLIYYKNLIKTAGVGSGTKITNNVQSLIVTNHDNAPALEYAKPNLLKFNSKDAHENSLFLVNRYKDNTFTMFVGKCIVAACKKENPDDQSVWATDANRLTMFIKKMMDDESKWISDKKGVQTTKYLINPILQKIKEMLIDYNKYLYSQVGKLPQNEVDYYNDIMIHCRELVHFIEHEKLADEILRYMAPRLTYEIK